jgi:hypothetical protein
VGGFFLGKTCSGFENLHGQQFLFPLIKEYRLHKVSILLKKLVGKS